MDKNKIFQILESGINGVGEKKRVGGSWGAAGEKRRRHLKSWVGVMEGVGSGFGYFHIL